LNNKIQSTGKNSFFFHFSHLRFIDKTDCKLSVSNGSVDALSTYKIKSIFHVRFCCWVFPLQLSDFNLLRMG